AISEGAATVEQLSDNLSLPAESVDRLLSACKAMELVREEDGRYVNFSDVERYLVRSSRTYYGDFLVYDAKVEYDGWKNLAREFTTSGEPVPRKPYASLASPEEARKFTTAGYNSSISLANKFAKTFDFSPYRKWLDFAGGSGCYSIAACERYPHLQSLVQDQVNVIPVTREFIAKHKLEDRIQAKVGNFLEPDYPRGFDLISFITPLQSYLPEEESKVFTYTYEALEPGGTILIIDYMLNEEKTGPIECTLKNLQMIRNGDYTGRVNSGAEFAELLTGVGFSEVDYWWLLPHQLGVVTAKKSP
ncbi:MAG: methyltransferase, partial [Desulfobacterales bacterium]